MSDTKLKNTVIASVLYAVAIFFTITSFVSIFSNVGDFRVIRDNDFSPSLSWYDGDNGLITHGTIAFILILITLISIACNYFIKQLDKFCNKIKRISELSVIIISAITIIYLLFAIFYLQANLPTTIHNVWTPEGTLQEVRIRRDSFLLFAEFRGFLLQPMITVSIILAFHSFNFFFDYKKEKIEA